ncbi:hypothetical protein AAFF_G00435720 [Aldrovandia affinis]|uniref:Uncharacterized protein n=1 Tax=Aldrovandia affinis TaxID=143900 RepID=A0AAD7S8I6_9TELE|nr:hypothetical protein AAFF_G00435720 [Aldrovandia affinis]
MVTLVTKHPSVYAQFLAGNFTVKKTTHAFSAIALDQAHEQNNALVKGDGGAVGLMENPAALRRWMVSGPEMARLISEFQATTEKRMKKTELKHHEQTKHTQVSFARDVRALTRVMGKTGNPFCEDSKDLLVLDSRDLADPAFINTLHQIEKLGQEQYDTLFIASQTRDGDLDEFFAHENQACPPALSQMGKIRLGTKSDLVGCLEGLITPRENDAASPPVEVMILDGAAIVNMLAPDENKVELFAFLATRIATTETEKQIIITNHQEVLCTQPRDVVGLAPCSHEEEADTRILLHVQDAVRQGYTKVSIRTVDTDVVILAVAAAGRLDIDELWVAFATGKNFRYLAAHEMAVALGPNKCQWLPFFHAFTGCDTVSCFSGRGKKTAWETWKACDEVTDEVTTAFCTLAATPTISTVDDYMDSLERFVVLLYDRTSSQEHVNEARKHLFTQRSRSIEAIPPTREALRQHIKRAAYQAGFCWGLMMICTPELPSPSEWGWVQSDNGWGICWTTLPEATEACRQLITCGCKKGCKGQCKCVKATLQCTALCHCVGDCTR